MIQLTPHMRILLAVTPVDFRRRMDGLARVCREVLGSDPQGGAVFCFKSRGGTSVRLLSYDGQGFWLCEKRLSAGTFKWWPRAGQQGVARMNVHELQLLLWNGNPAQAQAAPMWRPITAGAEPHLGHRGEPAGPQAAHGSL